MLFLCLLLFYFLKLFINVVQNNLSKAISSFLKHYCLKSYLFRYLVFVCENINLSHLKYANISKTLDIHLNRKTL